MKQQKQEGHFALHPSSLKVKVHGIFQARILQWVAFAFSKGSSQPRDRTQVSHLQADSLPTEPPGKPQHPYT